MEGAIEDRAAFSRTFLMEDEQIIREFLAESAENLARLDQDMVLLENRPNDSELLASIFRTIHTIKGTCGFFGFNRLGKVAHVTEDILSQLRNGARTLDTALTTLILQSVDATRRILASIEAGEGEGPVLELDLIAQLERARDQQIANVAEESASAAVPVPIKPTSEPAQPVAADTGGPASAASPARAVASADSALRVDVGLLDRLMNLVGELVLTRNQLAQFLGGRDDASLNAVSQRLNLITSELQEGVMKTRMQPIGIVWNKLPRVVRDLATSLEKQIALEMEGAETELDRTIIEAIKDPLTHIVRNSCDHGIESPREREARGKAPQGRLVLRAWHEGGQVNIEIADDGGGIDCARVQAKALERRLITDDQASRLTEREIVNLVFLPGFSTAAAVTNISGRGVGMDVVRTHIERIGGAVELTSRPGQGTIVRIRIPLTLAIIPGLIVKAGGERFVIPQVNLDELIQAGEGGPAIEYAHAAPVLRRRNHLVPLADLCDVLGLAPERRPGEASIVMVQAGQQRFGMIVDAICDSQEIVVKPMGHQLKPLNCYAGATIMGDGRIALILDIAGLAIRARMLESGGPAAPAATASQDGADAQHRLLLLFRAGEFTRLAAPLARVARLEKIAASTVEHASGHRVVQYRNRILPLLNLGEVLNGLGRWDEEILHVVVFRSGSTELGMVVDEITDIIDGSIVDPRGSDRQGLLGAAVIDGRITDLVDLDAVAQMASWSTSESLTKFAEALSEAGARPREEVLP